MSENHPHTPGPGSPEGPGASSGSRWEPAPADDRPQRHEQATDLLDRTQDHAAPPARPARASRRRRALAAAVGAGLLLVGGAGGYAIGHATAGSAAGAVRDHRGDGPGGFRGDRDDTGNPAGTGAASTGSTGPST